MSNENRKPLEEIREAVEQGPVDAALKLNETLSEGPIAEAGAKIIKASDEMAGKVSDEKLEKLTAPIEKLAQKIGGQDQGAIGNIVENATGDVAVTADTSDANPAELPQPPEIPEDVAQKIQTASSIYENTTGVDTPVTADTSDADPAAGPVLPGRPEGPVDAALKLNEALSEGPIAEAGAKIIKASDEMAGKVSDEKLEKLTAPIEKLAQKIGGLDQGTIGNIVENATGDVAVTADTSDANPAEPPEIPEDVAAGIRTAGSIIENSTGADAYVRPE